MKKIIVILSVLILNSCGYETMDITKIAVITEIGMSVEGENKCYYIGKGTKKSCISQGIAEESFIFYDTCGKFQIGDTLKIVKE